MTESCHGMNPLKGPESLRVPSGALEPTGSRRRGENPLVSKGKGVSMIPTPLASITRSLKPSSPEMHGLTIQSHVMTKSTTPSGMPTTPTGDSADVEEKFEKGQSPWLRRFVWMAVCFSMNHASVASVQALASVSIDPNLAACSLALLYLFYTLSAIFASMPLLTMLGSKWSLVVALILWCSYVVPFAIAVIPGVADEVIWVIVMLGSSVAGFGAGWLWTSQGAYFAACASRHADINEMPPEKVTGTFAAIFAFLYVGCEVVWKALSSVIESVASDKNSMIILFAFYAAAAIIGAFGMLFTTAIPPMTDSDAASGMDKSNLPEDFDDDVTETEEEEDDTWLVFRGVRNMLETMRDPKIWMLAPLNISFGVTAAYMGWYVNSQIASDPASGLGPTKVGYLTAIIPGLGTILSIPYAWLGKHFGKAPIMFSGCLSYFTIGMIGFLVPPDSLIKVGAPVIVLMYVIVGSGRAVYESTNRAVYADFFPDNPQGAFAFFALQVGVSGCIGYFMFSDFVPTGHEPNTKFVAVAEIITVVASISLVTVPLAFILNVIQKRRRLVDDDELYAGLIGPSQPMGVSVQAELEISCPKCGVRNPPQAKFCMDCGRNLKDDGRSNMRGSRKRGSRKRGSMGMRSTATSRARQRTISRSQMHMEELEFGHSRLSASSFMGRDPTNSAWRRVSHAPGL